ncbi:MAG: ArnT family glycosyltransferase [Pseudomonadota bacterium]
MKNKSASIIYPCIILLMAIYLRLRFVLYTPFELKIDAWSMYHYALNVVEGRYYGHCFGEHWARYAYWPPLYIFLSGFVYRFWGISQEFLFMRLLQVVFSTASCLLCYYIASEAVREYSGLHKEAGLVSGLLMAVNPRMVVYANHLYVETVFITLYLLIVYVGLRRYKYMIAVKASKRKGLAVLLPIVFFSVLLGLGNLTRPVLLLLPGVSFVFLLLFSTAKGLCLCRAVRLALLDTFLSLLFMLAVISPWVIRNHSVTGRLILIDTNGPINFYIAHNPLANGQWVDVKPHTDINRLYETGYREGLSYITGHLPREVQLLRLKQELLLYGADPHVKEASRYLDRAYMLPLYGSFVKMGLAKENLLNGFYKLPQLSFSFLWKSFALLLLLFMIRLMAAKRLGIILCEPAWIIGNLLYMNLVIQLFYYAPRYRIAVEPFLCISIGIFAAGIAASGKHIRSSQIDHQL